MAVHQQLLRSLGRLQHPVIFRAARIAQQQAVVLDQVVGLGGCAMPFQIIGRCHQNPPAFRDAAPLQRRILRLAQKERQVDPVRDDVDIAVRQPQPDFDAGIFVAEPRHQGRDQPPPQPQRRRDPQGAMRIARKPRNDRLGLVQGLDHPARAVIEGAPHLGRDQLAGGAVQQPHAEARLEILDAIRGNCRRHAQIAPARRDRPQFDHPHENPKTFKIWHGFHLLLSRNG